MFAFAKKEKREREKRSRQAARSWSAAMLVLGYEASARFCFSLQRAIRAPGQTARSVCLFTELKNHFQTQRSVSPTATAAANLSIYPIYKMPLSARFY